MICSRAGAGKLARSSVNTRKSTHNGRENAMNDGNRQDRISLKETLQWVTVSLLPRWLIGWCLIRAWAEFKPEYTWEQHETVSYWRVYARWMGDRHNSEDD